MKNFDEHRALARETQRVKTSLDALADLCDSAPRTTFQQLSALIQHDETDYFEGFGEHQDVAPPPLEPTLFDIVMPAIEPDATLRPTASYKHDAVCENGWFDDPETSLTQSNHDSHSSIYDSRLSDHSTDDVTDLFASQTSDDDTQNPPQIEQNTLSSGVQPADVNNPSGESINDVFEQFEW